MAGRCASPPPLIIKPDALSELKELEAVRDEYRSNGLYSQAAQVQRKIEHAKVEHEARHAQALAIKHQEALQEQERALASEVQSGAASWEQKLDGLKSQHAAEAHALSQQHLNDQYDMRARFDEEEARHHPGSRLLDMRRQEEHMRRQCRFTEADKIKSKADVIELQEQALSSQSLQARKEVAMQRLQSAQEKQLRALQVKHQAAWNDAIRAQRSDLERLYKRAQAARLALHRKQGKERQDLDLASKGWFNTHRLPPPKVQPSAQAAQHDGTLRPATAPAHLGSALANHQACKTPASSVAAFSTRVQVGTFGSLSSPSGSSTPVALTPKARALAVYSAHGRSRRNN